MRITSTQLRRIIQEELSRIVEYRKDSLSKTRRGGRGEEANPSLDFDEGHEGEPHEGSVDAEILSTYEGDGLEKFDEDAVDENAGQELLDLLGEDSLDDEMSHLRKNIGADRGHERALGHDIKDDEAELRRARRLKGRRG